MYILNIENATKMMVKDLGKLYLKIIINNKLY